MSQEYYSGAMASSFLNTEYVNMYNNITNIILVVSPRTGLEEKSVLLNAHFDSAMGSPGGCCSFHSLNCITGKQLAKLDMQYGHAVASNT